MLIGVGGVGVDRFSLGRVVEVLIFLQFLYIFSIVLYLLGFLA